MVLGRLAHHVWNMRTLRRMIMWSRLQKSQQVQVRHGLRNTHCNLVYPPYIFKLPINSNTDVGCQDVHAMPGICLAWAKHVPSIRLAPAWVQHAQEATSWFDSSVRPDWPSTGPRKLCTIFPHTSVLAKLPQLPYGAKYVFLGVGWVGGGLFFYLWLARAITECQQWPCLRPMPSDVVHSDIYYCLSNSCSPAKAEDG